MSIQSPTTGQNAFPGGYSSNRAPRVFLHPPHGPRFGVGALRLPDRRRVGFKGSLGETAEASRPAVLGRAYRRAGADPRVRQNLTLVVGLQGRLAEAENIVKADRPAEEAAANVAHLRRLLSRKESARKDLDTKPAAAVARPD